MITRVATVSPLFSSLWGSGHWSKMLSMSARDTTPIAPLMGEDQNSIIQVKTETRKEKGDSVTFSCWHVLQATATPRVRLLSATPKQ